MDKRVLVGLVLLTLMLNASADWPTLSHDYARTGLSDSTQLFSDTNLTLKWTFRVNDSIRASMSATDLDGNGKLELLVPVGNTLYCLSAHGIPVWTYTINSTIPSTPSLGDLDVDGFKEVVFGGDNGLLYVLDHNGSVKWIHTTNKSIKSSPVLADLNGDGKLEVYFASLNRRVYGLDYNGRVMWTYKLDSAPYYSPALGDINGDGESEVLVSSGNVLYALNNPPSGVWMYQVNGNIPAPPSSADINGDGDDEVLVGTEDGLLYALYYSVENQGSTNEISRFELLWNYSAGSAVSTTPSVGEVDGNLIVFFGSDDKTVYGVSNNGTRVLRYTVSKPVRSGLLLVDLDFDSNPEVIFGSDDKRVYMINSSGSTLWSYETEGLVRAMPIAVDLENRGDIDVIMGSYDGMVYVFHTLKAGLRREGDMNYARSEYHYLLNETDLALEYALLANESYGKVGYGEGMYVIELLLDRVNARKYCDLAVEAYDSGDLENAVLFALASDRAYARIDSTHGICSTLLSQSNADLYYHEAIYFYENEKYNESYVYGMEAKRLYNSLGNEDGVLEIDLLVEKNKAGATAKAYYDRALDYYLNDSNETALVYLDEAVKMYASVKHEVGLTNSAILRSMIITGSIDVKINPTSESSSATTTILASTTTLVLEVEENTFLGIPVGYIKTYIVLQLILIGILLYAIAYLKGN